MTALKKISLTLIITSWVRICINHISTWNLSFRAAIYYSIIKARMCWNRFQRAVLIFFEIYFFFFLLKLSLIIAWIELFFSIFSIIQTFNIPSKLSGLVTKLLNCIWSLNGVLLRLKILYGAYHCIVIIVKTCKRTHW